jgi:hypothetical protein
MALGFQKEMTTNVVAYKSFREGRLLLADPRAIGSINFTMFNSAKPTKKTKKQTFNLPDAWTKNLPEKFGALLVANSDRL